jgi:hypothetical protein
MGTLLRDAVGKLVSVGLTNGNLCSSDKLSTLLKQKHV